MKSPDNDIDRALQAALKRKFDDFEAEAEKSLEGVILSKPKYTAWQSAGRISLIAGGLLTLLLCGFLYFPFFKANRIATVIINKEHPFKDLTKLQRPSANRDSLKHETTPFENENKVKTLTVVTKRKKLLLLANPVKRTVKPNVIVKNGETTTNNFLVPGHSEKKEFRDSLKGSEGDLNSSYFDEQSHNVTPENKIISVVKTPEIIGNRPYLKYTFAPTLRVETISNRTKKGSTTYKKAKDFGFILNIIPLNPVQLLTIKASPGVIYQNINLPSEISLKRLGYKLTGGVKTGAFQFLFSYGQSGQSFGYEIASDEFELSKGTNDWTFVPKGIQYRQVNKHKFVGLGIKRHGTIKNPSVFQNYFGDIGLEISRELTTNTNLLWVNLAIGKQVPLSKNSQLNIGPYIEYSFSKMVNPDTKFEIQPYQIGLSIGLTYGKR